MKKNVYILLILVLFFVVFSFFFLQNKSDVEPQSSNIQDSDSLSYFDVENLRHMSAFESSPFVEDSVGSVPTNQWFSSVAFTSASEPLFSSPLSIQMTTTGFDVSYPDIVSTSDTVFASHIPDFEIVFSFDGLVSSVLSHDDLSVEIVQKKDESVISQLRFTRGSPFIFGSVDAQDSFYISFSGAEIVEEGADFVLFSFSEKYFSFFCHFLLFAINLYHSSLCSL